MRILHINDTYKTVGGTEVYLNSVSSTFKEKGHEIFRFSIDDEEDTEESNLLVYRDIFKRNPSKYIFWYYLNPSLYNRLQKWIKKVNPDIIHIHINGKFASSILLALNGNSIPVVQTVHDSALICPISSCINSQGVPCEGGLGIKCPRNGCISWARYAYQRLPEYMKIYLRELPRPAGWQGRSFLRVLPSFGFSSKNFNSIGKPVLSKIINKLLIACPEGILR